MKPGIPKGTRDFGPEQVRKRHFIMSTLQDVFEQHGFQPIETPAMENINTLTGKYGDEGDQLLFRILNSGNYLKNIHPDDLKIENYKSILSKIADKGLRYDLTVPLARYVVMHRNEITFPFKRYQIQPVWRADRPQKGRYREFWQCDVDILGSHSILNELELIRIFNTAFKQLGINDFTIRLNHRKILEGLVDAFEISDQFIPFTVILDKMDKIGLDGICIELQKKSFPGTFIKFIKQALEKGLPDLAFLEKHIGNTKAGKQGIAELEELLMLVESIDNNHVQFDVSLARGLSYYTGSIMEVVAHGAAVGSICGGGRYDDLTGLFGLKDIAGVGMSFGLERIYDVMEQLELFKAITGSGKLQVSILHFDTDSLHYGSKVLSQLLDAGIAAEIYPDSLKMNKQMKYADARNVPYAIIIGSEERNSELLTLKNMQNGNQQKLSVADIIQYLRKI